jgi:hypothetical protein
VSQNTLTLLDKFEKTILNYFISSSLAKLEQPENLKLAPPLINIFVDFARIDAGRNDS